GLNIAVSGMSTYNAGLTTTAHNISNVKTKGYSKQSVIQSAKEAISLRTSYGMLGAGVNATDVVSSRDEYYDAKYRINNSNVGKYDIESFYLSSIEDYIYPKDKDVGSITNSMDSFFASLKYLTTSSMDTTIRAEVAGYADTLAYYVRDVGTKLQNLQTDVNTEIETTVKQINAYAAQIASLNKQINTLEVYGDRANDLRDQRAVILDQLSELADITVTEKAPADGNGTNQFIVNLGGGVLVDTTTYNTINVTSDNLKIYQNDASNLYHLTWSYGQDFDSHSTTLGGKLQGLFELRDGNNGENFKATLTKVTREDAAYNNRSTLTIQSDEYSSVNASDLAKLDLPATDGVLTIGKLEYAYESFTATVAADGTYTYTFVLKENLTEGQTQRLDTIIQSTDPDPTKKQATAGDSIAFRGIPYYMAQLNEFIRTFSANFNSVQNQGYDYNGNRGKDLFVAADITSGKEYTMHEFLFDESDGFYYYNSAKVFDSTKKQAYEQQGYKFEAVGDNYYNLKNAAGEIVEKVYVPAEDANIFTFGSVNAEGSQISYYNMSVLNYYACNDIVEDSRLLACSAENTEGASGWEEAKNLAKMLALQTDNTMFKQGDPGSFLNVLSTAVLGVDSARVTASCENATNILNAVDHRRTSISGVDEDEEGQDLIIYQNLLNYQYRVLSVMNEVLDKLINETAV
ncbi:MAG: flagellar hook-associated protein FlgK, partial [Lachnospiraceae bacterium]|nr:flagellar hook-associated protein FlgK [Lachnospiraceae bacterium]